MQTGDAEILRPLIDEAGVYFVLKSPGGVDPPVGAIRKKSPSGCWWQPSHKWIHPALDSTHRGVPIRRLKHSPMSLWTGSRLEQLNQDGRVAFVEVEPRYADSPDRGWPLLETTDLAIGDERVPLDTPQIHRSAWAPDGSRVAVLIQLVAGAFDNELRVITTTP